MNGAPKGFEKGVSQIVLLRIKAEVRKGRQSFKKGVVEITWILHPYFSYQ